jgi:class 3 adenylate cyclase
MTPKLDPLLGLHFRNVLGDALCAERRLARCRRPRLACAVDAHDAVVRAQLTCFRGRGVNTSGDGFLAMFEVRGDDIGGIGVHIGARVSALAGANEVLVSSTLRDLVIGVPGEWRLFAVASP